MLAGRAAGTPSVAAGTSAAVSGEPRSGAGAVLAEDTGAGSDGVVVVAGTDSSVAVGSDCQYTGAGSPLGQTVSPPVFVTTTVRCSGVGCGAGSGSVLGGTESVGAGGGSVSVGGGSTTTGGGGDVVTTGGGDVGVGAGSATSCFPPLTIVVVLSPVVGWGCSAAEEGCSFAQASVELRTTKAKRHKTSAITRARGLGSCRWAWMAVLLCGRPRVKSLGTLPIVVPR